MLGVRALSPLVCMQRTTGCIRSDRAADDERQQRGDDSVALLPALECRWEPQFALRVVAPPLHRSTPPVTISTTGRRSPHYGYGAAVFSSPALATPSLLSHCRPSSLPPFRLSEAVSVPPVPSVYLLVLSALLGATAAAMTSASRSRCARALLSPPQPPLSSGRPLSSFPAAFSSSFFSRSSAASLARPFHSSVCPARALLLQAAPSPPPSAGPAPTPSALSAPVPPSSASTHWRVFTSSVDETKPLQLSLQAVYGIGLFRARELCGQLGLNPRARTSTLGASFSRVRALIESRYSPRHVAEKVAQAAILDKVRIGSYQGIRHAQALPVRGQRTQTQRQDAEEARQAAPDAVQHPHLQQEEAAAHLRQAGAEHAGAGGQRRGRGWRRTAEAGHQAGARPRQAEVRPTAAALH